MNYQPEVSTITKSAPPSYAEATGATAPMRDDIHEQSAGTQPQMPYGQHTAGYLHPAQLHKNDFYPTVMPQPSYNPSFIPTPPYAAPPVAPNATATAHCIIQTEHVDRRQRRCCGCCNKKCFILLISFILAVYVVKVIVSHNM